MITNKEESNKDEEVKNIDYKEENNKEENNKEENNKEESNEINKERNKRQEYNNQIAYEEITKNPENISINNINNKALERLLEYTNYKDYKELIEDKNNYEEIINKISSLYIAKNASRQGSKDEELQLKHINILQDYEINIIKDGKQRPIIGGGISKFKKKGVNELKSIDFLIKYKKEDIGYISAKVCSGNGGHQDNVLHELSQYCEWALIELKNDNNNKAYIILYDNFETSLLYNEIKMKYKNDNIIFTNTKNFRKDFLVYYNKR